MPRKEINSLGLVIGYIGQIKTIVKYEKEQAPPNAIE